MRNALLLLASTIVTLLALEGLMRLTLAPSSLHSGFETVPMLNQWRNEVKFWEAYAGRENLDIGSYDPLLGWDNREGDLRHRGARPVAREPLPGTLRVIAIGDSFVWGNEVGEQENFSFQLETLLPWTEVLNMGVPGYGIDQAYLKFVYHGEAYRPHMVVFGIYTADYERSSMSFTAFAKPRFVRTGTGYRIDNQPVPGPAEALARIDAALEGRSWLLDWSANVYNKLTIGEREASAYLAEMDGVVEHILASLQARLASDQHLVIVHIPRAEVFVEADPLEARVGAHLLTVYRKLGIDHVDLAEAFLENASAREVFDGYYVHRPNGSVGHLSATGHRQVAELLAHRLAALRGR